MKPCILCGKEHEGPCDKTQWDGVLSTKYNIPMNVSYIETKELVALERELVTKKRGRKPRNG